LSAPEAGNDILNGAEETDACVNGESDQNCE
jgi:hypothetical protein